ncbi:MAG: glutamine amidotransferase [Myxococcales bacterium]
MAALLIVKTGTTVPNVAPRRGDFESWFAAGMGLPLAQARVVRVDLGEALPAPDSAQAIVVTGSAAMVSDRADWSERTAAWLREVVAADVPMLAVCYGHQLLAHAFGGVVAKNPRGRSIGTVDVELLPAAERDPLFTGFRSPLHLPVSHLEAVLELPDGATRLATTARDPNHAFALGERTWAVQFHPEFDADIVRGYIEARRDTIAGEGQDPDALQAAARDTDHGTLILRRFAHLALRSG